MEVNLYDFDKTIYKRDSSTDFVFFCLKKYPKLITHIPIIIKAFILYKIKKITKTEMKEMFFSFLKRLDNQEKLVELFWDSHKHLLKEFYLNKKHDNDIIISASPEFLLRPIAEYLEVYDLIGSDVDIKTGKFNLPNCHNQEKVNRLNSKYKNIKVNETYSDSLKSDEPILRLAKQPFLVKNEKIIPHNFS